MSTRQHFTTEQARKFGDKFGIDWDWNRSDIEQFPMGLDIELEHGLHTTSKVVKGNDLNLTSKFALAYLNEFADYRSLLEKLEGEAREENIQSMKHVYLRWRNSLGVSSKMNGN